MTISPLTGQITNNMDGTEDDVLWQDIAEQAAADEENDMDEDLLCNDTDLMPLEKVHQLLFEENDDDDDQERRMHPQTQQNTAHSLHST